MKKLILALAALLVFALVVADYFEWFALLTFFPIFD